ncbi:inovirus-type Gp2 protein [Ralstonia pseudosolanacearum]|uniref:YagK/YfjJ domain-containing protein n=1 Tax=Ralstonia pseudosolanacearum TaxID=1310165 RepID=UPI0009C0FE31|nr:inovirus-type Gp2 protein [Ralstonia pseudosolanacearum]MCL1618251.1 inovirus Gp2 family protein [Ralstonia pseudosolanacearum CaRs-Mep]
MKSAVNLHVIRSKDVNYTLPYFMDGIVDLMRFMDMVVYKDLLFYMEPMRGNGTRMRKVSPLGEHIERLHTYSRLYSSGYTFSPLISFFFEQYRKHPIKDWALVLNRFDPDGSDSGIFNDFVMTMRREAVATRLKKRIFDWDGKFEESSDRLVKLEAELFREYARLMVIRLDFNYHKAIFTDKEVEELCAEVVERRECDLDDYLAGADISTPGTIEGRIALEEVQKDRKRFFANMKGKPSLFKHLVGYIWRIEYTRGAGYHMHVMLFLDGEHVEKHEYYAQEIGCYWRDMITQGRGYFENCNRKKSGYGNNWALGRIDHWDYAKRDRLRKAMQYFCKTSQIVQVVPYPKCRLFQTVMIRRQSKGAGGRPRTRGVVDAANQRPAC